MLGMRRGRVNEGHTDSRREGQSRDFRLSQALAYPVVKKGVCGGFILCGLSPPVSEGGAAGPLVYPVRRCEQASSALRF
jgi:hypothetical protein